MKNIEVYRYRYIVIGLCVCVCGSSFPISALREVLEAMTAQ